MNIKNFIDCRISDAKLSYLNLLISRNVNTPDTVMDIGCGNTMLNKVEWRELYRVDPTLIPTRKPYDTVGTWEDAIEILKRRNIDCVFLMDVIEHLPKQEALKLLKRTEPLTKQIVVFTPYGFMEQDDGGWNSHRGGWTEDDFGEGWRTWILHNFHTLDFKGNKLQNPVSALLAIYTQPHNMF